MIKRFLKFILFLRRETKRRLFIARLGYSVAVRWMRHLTDRYNLILCHDTSDGEYKKNYTKKL